MNKFETAIENNSHNSRVVLDFIAIIKRVFDRAKQPGFTVADWDPLTQLVAVDEFEWAGPFREVLNWQGHIEFLTRWARTVTWQSTLYRMHEWQGIVFLEHEEQITIGDTVEVTRAVSVYQFNEAGKIRHLAVYVQRELSLGL